MPNPEPNPEPRDDDDECLDKRRLPRAHVAISKIYDGRFSYISPHGFPSSCHLRIYEHPDRPFVVVATELADNPGTSICNALPGLLDTVSSAFEIDPNMILWIEHFPATDSFAESIDGVWHDEKRAPHWVTMTRERVEDFIGERLDLPDLIRRN